jgi:hypothetical protein
VASSQSHFSLQSITRLGVHNGVSLEMFRKPPVKCRGYRQRVGDMAASQLTDDYTTSVIAAGLWNGRRSSSVAAIGTHGERP